MPVVMFDIDDTLVNNTVIENVLKKFGCEDTRIQFDYFSMDIPAEAKDLITAKFVCNDTVSSFEPNPGMKELVQKLHEKGFKLISITARPEYVRTGTMVMMRKHFPQIQNVFFAGSFNKIEFIKAQGVTHIDDSAKVMSDCQGLGLKLFMISNDMTKHNHEFVSAGGFEAIVIDKIGDADAFIAEHFEC